MKSSSMCIPRLRTAATCSVKTHRVSHHHPVSLLHRFRESVFRLMMISADTSSSSSSSDRHRTVRRASYRGYLADPYHSEAVADCIEFIKKTAITDGDHEEEDEANAVMHVM